MIKALLLLLISTQTFATGPTGNDTDGYKYVDNQFQKHELYSTCKFVEGVYANGAYMPTKTSTEWTNFFTNARTNHFLVNNCHTGVDYSGTAYTHSSQKFYMGTDFQSCDEVCADKGGCVAAGFNLITSLADCKTIVEGIATAAAGSVPTYTNAAAQAADNTTDPDSNPNSPSTALGCTLYESVAIKIGAVQVRRFTTNAATCNSMTTTEGYTRVCPCAN